MPSLSKARHLYKPKLLRSNPAVALYALNDSDEDDTDFDDEGILTGYRSPKLQKSKSSNDNNEELSDYVKLRLFFARQLAMKRYNEKWG